MKRPTKRPTYTIIAGSNGTGKTTLREIFKELIVGKIIDPDLISKKLDKNLPQSKRDILAGRQAIKLSKEFLKDKESFCQETTLSGKCLNINKNIELAKLQGYNVRLIYIAIQDPNMAIKNIKDRVNSGGHNVPDEKVLSRFNQSYDNLKEISKKVDEITIVDNSNKDYNKIIEIKNGHVKYKNNEIPEWLQETTGKVIENSRIREDKVVKVKEKDFNKIKNCNFPIRVNPFDIELGAALLTVLIPKEIIKNIEKTLNLDLGFSRDR